MRFYFPQRFPSVLLLLVALTCATQASSLRARRSVWNDIGNTLNNIGQTIKDTIQKTRIDSLFHNSTTDSERMQPTLEVNKTWIPLEKNRTAEGVSREIIDAPVRCPPNHVIVKDKCRIAAR